MLRPPAAEIRIGVRQFFNQIPEKHLTGGAQNVVAAGQNRTLIIGASGIVGSNLI
jgi:hypothetical protein